jgi:hypothetical protein
MGVSSAGRQRTSSQRVLGKFGMDRFLRNARQLVE